MMLRMMMSRGRKRMMLRMMMLRRRRRRRRRMRRRRRKIMILRMLMWWRRTDLKTAPHVLCEPAQSKCTSTCHRSRFIRKFSGKMPRPRLSPERRHTLCGGLRSRNALEHRIRATFIRKFPGKMPRPRTQTHTLCEPAQLKCTSTFHKGHFIRKLTGKMLRPSWSTLIKHWPLLLP